MAAEVTQTELVTLVNAATAKVVKIGTESRTLLEKIDVLVTQLAKKPLADPDLVAAVAALTDQAQVVDDLVRF